MTENNNTAIYSVTDKNQDLNNEVPLRPRRVVGGPPVEKEAGDGGPQAQGEGGGGEPQAQGEGTPTGDHSDTSRHAPFHNTVQCQETDQVSLADQATGGSLSPDTQRKLKRLECMLEANDGDMRIIKTKAEGRDCTSTMLPRGRIAILDQEAEHEDEAVHEEKNAELTEKHAEEQDLKSANVQKQMLEYKKIKEQQAQEIKELTEKIKEQAQVIERQKRALEDYKLQEETKLKRSYPMERMPRGQALIINVKNVRGKPERKSTDKDRDKMKEMLLKLGFQVTIYNDGDGLTKEGMTEKIKKFAKMVEHWTADACVICLMSHGNEVCIFGNRGKKIYLDEVFMIFDNEHCPSLLNKPKIFFIQACRRGNKDKRVMKKLEQNPSMSDMLICHSTLSGYRSKRDRKYGTWFIGAVHKVFMEYAENEDICTMLIKVNELVSQKVHGNQEQQKKNGIVQIPVFSCTLCKTLYFPKIFPGVGVPLCSDEKRVDDATPEEGTGMDRDKEPVDMKRLHIDKRDD